MLIPKAQGFIEAKIDKLLHGTVPTAELNDWIIDLKDRLEQQNGIKALMGALFCQWRFAAPDPMHPVNRGDMLPALYEAHASINGIQSVQKMDKVSMRLLFSKPEYTDGLWKTQQTELIKRFVRTLREVCSFETPATSSFCFEDWVLRAVKLKDELMISQLDYRIRFCASGSKFDSSWIEAEDFQGLKLRAETLEDKHVAMCLFPAIMDQDAEIMEEGVEIAAVLVTNKRFFPYRKEKKIFDPSGIISKAIVMVE
ncbi:hypothetical protein T440DRAFT_466285 [Plenodomus tracheiphilus IPT5]|uniref:Uncharacterized protein n=1 Tax=Plenodomus tracheiphilus IPT5 TaxID=1408161 RepID=A0A6A7BD67_9PLEO|nr:hypothetical protein T440DRAFT_466285 [Plenodomus tracheiphilus IPT5]